VLKGEKFAF